MPVDDDEFKRFDKAMDKIMSVSTKELDRRLATPQSDSDRGSILLATEVPTLI
jgi:hypothetical protein